MNLIVGDNGTASSFSQQDDDISGLNQLSGSAETDCAAEVEISIDSEVISKMQNWFGLPEAQLIQIIKEDCGSFQ